jgi:hypothetical protein
VQPARRAPQSLSLGSFGGRELLVKTTAKTASRRRRPKTVPKGNTAKFFSYAAAFGWIKRSIAHRFFLEAVTLEERIISDRLISYLCRVGSLKADRNPEKQSFASLIDIWRKVITTPIHDDLFKDLQATTDEWRNRRNSVVHGMVKSSPGSVHHDIADFKKAARSVA